MEKRLPLALLLSAIVILVYSRFVAPPPPAPAPAPAVSDPLEAGRAAEGDRAARKAAAEAMTYVSEPIRAESEETLELFIGTPGEAGSYRATFTNRGALLRELRLADYYDQVDLPESERGDPMHWIELAIPAKSGGSLLLASSPSSVGLLRPDEDLDEALWTMREVRDDSGAIGVDFEYAPGTGVVFEKRVRFVPGKHVFELELAIRNEAAPTAVGPKQFRFTPVDVVPRVQYDKFYQAPQIALGVIDEGAVEVEVQMPQLSARGKTGGVIPARSGIDFAAVHNKYFAFAMRDDRPAAETGVRASQSMIGATWRREIDERWIALHPDEAEDGNRLLVADLQLRLAVPPVGERSAQGYRIWAGPKKEQLFVAEYADYGELLRKDLGFFASISRILISILRFFEGIVGNWGVAIILLTITVRLVLFPLNRRSQTAMARYQAKMKRLQPKIDEIKKRYEKDPGKLRQEQAALMQKEGAFPPLGGCAPMFLQIPVFFGLFQALRVVFDLRQAPFFGWIRDLSQPDRLLPTGIATELPLLGPVDYVNVLPPLMVFLWIWQQRSMPQPADEQAARMQKMMMWMPVVFGLMLYNYAAGLSVYMITQSGLGIFEQRFIKKHWPVDDTEKPRKKTGFMARMAELQAQKMKELEAAQRKKAKARR